MHELAELRRGDLLLLIDNPGVDYSPVFVYLIKDGTVYYTFRGRMDVYPLDEFNEILQEYALISRIADGL